MAKNAKQTVYRNSVNSTTRNTQRKQAMKDSARTRNTLKKRQKRIGK